MIGMRSEAPGGEVGTRDNASEPHGTALRGSRLVAALEDQVDALMAEVDRLVLEREVGSAVDAPD